MATREEGRLSRWSRLKRQDRERPAAEAERAPGVSVVATDVERESGDLLADAEVSATAAAAVAPDDGAAAVAPEDLPDIDSLDRDSDFAPFMRRGVPEHLQRLALRKLWTSDPVLANLDGLNDYDPDNLPFLTTVTQTAEKLLRERLKDAGREADADAVEAAAEPAPDAAGDADPALPADDAAAPEPPETVADIDPDMPPPDGERT